MIVLVTGATSGFGRAIARRFARDGHRIIAVGRRTELLASLRDELGAAAVHAVTLDVRDRPAVERAVAELPAELAAVDLLVNNAGLALGLEPAYRASIEDWERMVDTNVKGLMAVTRATIAGTSSASGRRPAAGRTSAATFTAERRRSCTSSR